MYVPFFFRADERPPQFNDGQRPLNKNGQNPPRRMRSSLTLFTNQQPGADNQQNRVGQENRGDGAAGDANEAVLNQQDNENHPVGNREPAAGNN
ncbi:hypothetical protein TNCT_441751 [Trichonephila clavata]|uniref:Uncharacterized protein n=1 Tax=Trichonephila clavata TaxID=2740835 RepID=A0A8X6FMV5_TRICU|nr:hypothetical protein TNCT_441751 [Trichonephila clavata]